MKPARFDHVAARDLDHALAVLAANPEGGRLLAGGQSLMPLLNMRLARPDVLIDLNRVAGLGEIEDCGEVVRIGALARHADIETSALLAADLPLLPCAVRHVAHAAIRNRGTLGGSLALADPAAELPACSLALDATIIARSVRGERRIAADGFFQGVWRTALEPDEAIVAVEFPKMSRDGFAFLEFSRRRGDFALAGIVLVRNRRAGARAVVFGLGERPVRLPGVEAWLDGQAGAAAATDDVLVIFTDGLAAAAGGQDDAAFRIAVARTLFARALKALASAHERPDGRDGA